MGFLKYFKCAKRSVFCVEHGSFISTKYPKLDSSSSYIDLHFLRGVLLLYCNFLVNALVSFSFAFLLCC